MRLSRLHFYVNAAKPEAAAVRARLAERLAAYGLKESSPAAAEAIVALGGDGTILRAVRDFPTIPVVGFNLGGLGYLSSVESKDFDRALALLADGRFRLSTRTVLSVRRAGASEQPRPALNDVVLVREMTGHAAGLDLSVDGRAATRYLADGLVIATPTGSTAYSLSAGGPVLMPDSGGFVITPMNPHALGVRPLVVADTVRLTVVSRPRAGDRTDRLGVYADGASVFMLAPGEAIDIEKAPRAATLIELDGHDPYEVLGRKLGWRGTSVPDGRC